MRKTLLPLMAVLALGGAAILTAQAQPMSPGRNPGMQNQRSQMTPEQRSERMQRRCDDRFAKQVGRLAYVQAKLDITPAQQGVFDRWKSVKTDIAKRHAASCAARPVAQRDAASRPTPGERMARQETMLKQRLADLAQERPAMEALYASLSTEQKTALTPHHGGGRNGMRGGRFQRGGNGGPNRRPGGDRAPI